MKVSLKWLSKYVDISSLTPEELSSIISKAGTEIEEISYFAKGTNLVVGEVIECEDIEGTHLHLCVNKGLTNNGISIFSGCI